MMKLVVHLIFTQAVAQLNGRVIQLVLRSWTIYFTALLSEATPQKSTIYILIFSFQS